MLLYVFLSEGKHLLMFNVQLCLIFERVPVMLKCPLHSAIVYGYRYYSYDTLSLIQRAVALLVLY